MYKKKETMNVSEMLRLDGRIDKKGNIYFVGEINKPIMIDMNDTVVLCFTDVNPDNLRRNRTREDNYTANLVFKFYSRREPQDEEEEEDIDE